MLLLVLVLGVPREHQNRSEIEIDASTKAFFSGDRVREGVPLIGVFLEGTTPTR
jgi:hypothetical protein